MILGYALSIHKLQGATCDKVILNAGPREFAQGLMLVGATRVREFSNLAFHPFPNFQRFREAMTGAAFQKRRAEEIREEALAEATEEEYASVYQRFLHMFHPQVLLSFPCSACCYPLKTFLFVFFSVIDDQR